MHAYSVMSDPCNPMDCILPGFSLHGISLARILKWVAISFHRLPSQPRNRTHISGVFCSGRQIFFVVFWFLVFFFFVFFFTTSATWNECVLIEKSEVKKSQNGILLDLPPPNNPRRYFRAVSPSLLHCFYIVSGCTFSGLLGSRGHKVITQEVYQVVPLGPTCVGKVKEAGGRTPTVRQPQWRPQPTLLGPVELG